MNSPLSTSPFTGSIPRHYDEYLGPMFFEDYAIEVASRIDPDTVKLALELCSGTGRVTNHLRKVLPESTRLIASDLSEEMIEVAKDKLRGQNIQWSKIDLNELPFEDNNVDLIVCCFGYMFAQDKVKAFKEARRVLRPGGILLISTWGKLEDNEASWVFRKEVRKYLGDPLPEMWNLPYSMHDPAVLKDNLDQAGFVDVTVDLVRKNSTSATAALATYGMVQGGSLYNELIKRNPAWVQEILVNVEKELAEKFGAAPMVAPMQALIARARK